MEGAGRCGGGGAGEMIVLGGGAAEIKRGEWRAEGGRAEGVQVRQRGAWLRSKGAGGGLRGREAKLR